MGLTVLSCNQEGCTAPAAFRFTWPGKEEQGICAEHAPKLRGVANAIGLLLPMHPLPSLQLPAASARQAGDELPGAEG